MGFTTAAIIGGVSAIGGGIASSEAARRGARRAGLAARDMVGEYDPSLVPSVENQELALLMPQLVGEYAPGMEQALALDPSAMEGVTASAAAKDAQLRALERMAEIGEGGLTEADAAAAREMRRQVAQDAQAQQEAILSGMQQRGTLGSGMELAARLQSQQAAADRLSRGGDVLTQQAQARALQALGQTGTMASRLRGQEFGEQADVAKARDIINRFNLQNRQSIAQRNIAEQNRAMQMNLAAKQAMADEQTRLKNMQQQYNKELLQREFENRMRIAAGRAGGHAAAGKAAQEAAQGQARALSGAASGIGTIAGAFMQPKAKNWWEKDDKDK